VGGKGCVFQFSSVQNASSSTKNDLSEPEGSNRTSCEDMSARHGTLDVLFSLAHHAKQDAKCVVGKHSGFVVSSRLAFVCVLLHQVAVLLVLAANNLRVHSKKNRRKRSADRLAFHLSAMYLSKETRRAAERGFIVALSAQHVRFGRTPAPLFCRSIPRDAFQN